MIRGFLLLSIGASLFANSEYIPFSKFSKTEKIENNFIKIEKVKPISRNISQIKEIKENTDIVKEYKRENILKENIKKEKENFFENSFSKDLSITPRISYMNVTPKIDNSSAKKAHEIVPEISFSYKKNTLKADYFKVNTDFTNIIKFDTNWYRLSYLYKINNANVGIGYNNLKLKSENIDKGKDSEKFPTLEAHFKNTQDKLVLEYGGFYGQNDGEIKSAYEYYLNIGYKIFNNDNLVFNLGYKNRTVDYDGLELSYKGPVLGISTTF